ncbi:hypothetical protein [Nocardia sp. NPDC060249]|uniref:hypothetical protein n=1 Tax=Nocardia sp. NPDC060249 TaxID=3347082 RepID=UPI00364B4A6C
MRINEITISGEVWITDDEITGGHDMWLDGEIEVEIEQRHVLLKFFANDQHQRIKFPISDLAELAALAEKRSR